MKVLICGGRGYDNQDFLESELDKLLQSKLISYVITGDATGADALAFIWAKKRNIGIHIYQANWKEHGKAAGPIRNKTMLDLNPDIELVIAFEGGKGTANMVKQARARHIEILELSEKI